MGLCFAYMEKPDTEKHSNDESNEKFNCGTSSMQGWRETQEDAYNCILDYDTDTSYFAVYDGHGGEEVALYCSQKLPDFLKHLEDYKTGNIEKALEGAFLQFDASLLTNDVSEELQEIRNQVYKERKKKDNRSDSSSDSEEEDVDDLYKEAIMPIEELVEKYKKGEIYNRHVADPKRSASCSSKDAVISCGSNNEMPETSGIVVSTTTVKCDVNLKKNSSSLQTSDEVLTEVNENCTKLESKVDGSLDVKDTPSTIVNEKEISRNGEFESIQNSESTRATVSSLYKALYENCKMLKKGKGKAVAKTKGVTPEVPTIERPKRKTNNELGQVLLSSEEDDEEFEDEKDFTFNGSDESTDDDDDDDNDNGDEGMNDSRQTSEDSSVEDEDDERTKRYEKFCKSKEQSEENWSIPFDSAFKCGSTAVVALIKGSELYVANAGDSRCVLCRNGKAVAMSFDHNPFLAQEEARVKKAGGYVGKDGRVNGGLNLSRALGDHSYKQNKELSDREQIITALPDVKTITIKPDEDEFMILACDGIWNSMSRQKVVDFVRTRIEAGEEKMSAICEELFDSCLSPNTFDDGLGCDNMTAVIVQFKYKKSLKKSLSNPDLEEETKSKKMKSSEEA